LRCGCNEGQGQHGLRSQCCGHEAASGETTKVAGEFRIFATHKELCLDVCWDKGFPLVSFFVNKVRLLLTVAVEVLLPLVSLISSDNREF